MNNFLKWLLIHKGSKVVTLLPDPITDVQTVMLRRHGRILTKEWGGKIYYDFTDIRKATQKEIKQGFRDITG